MKGRKNEYIMKEMFTTILYQEEHSSYVTRNGETEKKKIEIHLIPQNWKLDCLKVSAHNHKKRCSDEHTVTGKIKKGMMNQEAVDKDY